MESAAIDYAMKALYLVLMLSMPPIIVASLIGILLSLIQAIHPVAGTDADLRRQAAGRSPDPLHHGGMAQR